MNPPRRYWLVFSSIHETSFACAALLGSSARQLLSLLPLTPASLTRSFSLFAVGSGSSRLMWVTLAWFCGAPEDGRVSQRSVPSHQSRLAGGQQAADGNKLSQCREGCRGAGAGSVAQKRCEEGRWSVAGMGERQPAGWSVYAWWEGSAGRE